MWAVLCICFSLIMVLIGLAAWFRKNLPKGLQTEDIEKKNLLQEEKSKKIWFEFGYPFSYKIYDFVQRKRLFCISEEKINQLQKICMNQGRESLEEYYFCYRFVVIYWMVIGVSCFVMLGVLAENGDSIFDGGYFLAREEPGGGEQKVALEAEAQGEVREVTITIPERAYTVKELKTKMKEAKEYILKYYLGENPSEEKISKPLQLVSKIPDSQILVKWKMDADGYINADGTINQEEIKEEKEVTIQAVLSYREVKEKISFAITLLPRKKTKKEQFWEEWNAILADYQEKTQQEKFLSLPKEVKGIPVTYMEKKSSPWLGIFVLGLLGCFLVPWFIDYRTEQRIIQREEELRREYPELVERFILLMGAGLSIRGTWYRIAKDYERRCQEGSLKHHYLYEEMLITCRAMDNGQNEMTAYSDFGRRVSLIQYMRFQTLLIQNLKKGSKDLLQRMESEAGNALQERKEMARKSGEEAGTKLLVPMMLMLAVVFAMILIAAFQNI